MAFRKRTRKRLPSCDFSLGDLACHFFSLPEYMVGPTTPTAGFLLGLVPGGYLACGNWESEGSHRALYKSASGMGASAVVAQTDSSSRLDGFPLCLYSRYPSRWMGGAQRG